MALTLKSLKYHTAGNQRRVRGTIDFDASYPTGGEALAAKDLGLSVIDELRIFPKNGFVFEWDATNAKVKAFSQGFVTGSTAQADSVLGALAENDADAEGTFRAMGVAVDTTIKLGELLEVTSTTDLSGVTAVRFEALGV